MPAGPSGVNKGTRGFASGTYRVFVRAELDVSALTRATASVRPTVIGAIA